VSGDVEAQAWDSDGQSLASTLGQPSARMRPVTFAGCFGWLHVGAAPGGSDTAAVLCRGIGRDGGTAHRSFRKLADHLAASGVPALRFDYRGTGDSRDAEGEEAWDAWYESLCSAVDWARAATGARRVVLIGLRLGATLAACAASSRGDIAGLVLLEPVLRGKSYVTQLMVEARLRGPTAAPTDRLASDGLALDELYLGRDTLRLLSGIDLRTMSFGAGCAVSVFSRAPGSLLAACETAWQDGGSPVTRSDFTGLEPMLRLCHLAADEPLADVAPILSWLRSVIRPQPAPAPPAVPSSTALTLPGCTETPIRFGGEGHLFGVLCRPSGGAASDLGVIIGNTGGDPHYGLARFSVELARRLACLGIASLRIDFAGLGDSLNPASAGTGETTHTFAVDRTADLAAAADAMQRFGYRRFALNGLCSGAYHAYQGALADDRVVALLLVNLPWFKLGLDKPGPASAARRGTSCLSRRGASTLLMYSVDDPGLTVLERHFGPGGAALHDVPGVSVQIVPGLDHDLTGTAMRREAGDRMIAFLQRTMLAARPPATRRPEENSAENAFSDVVLDVAL
jgi:alpha-beta hydrolase superfamily lysophospholipase